MRKVITFIVALVLVLSILLVNVGAVSAEECKPAGLTPGYWKNHLDVWYGADPNQSLESLFNVPDDLDMDSLSLLEALNFGGGPGNIGAAKILLRAAVAAYLNSEDVSLGYFYGAGTVLSMTNSALSSLDRTTMLSLATTFDYYNNL